MLQDDIARKVSFDLNPPEWLYDAMKKPCVDVLEQGDTYRVTYDAMQLVRGNVHLKLRNEINIKTRHN